MWRCSCGAENKVSQQLCLRCGLPMPRSEREKVYRKQLDYAQNKQWDLAERWVNDMWRKILTLFGTAPEKVGKDIADVVETVKDEFKNSF